MGMPVTVEVVDPGAEEAVEEAFADFRLLDRTFSPFLAGSAVSRINRGELEVEAAGPLVAQAVDLCRRYEQATHGYFSAWLDGRFDPSGLVKGWAIDRAASILHRHGFHNFFVDAAGDVQTRGHKVGGEPWRVGVRHPLERDKVACVILAADLAVATSGTYEKGDHIVDPHTGRPARELLSFTVVGPDILQADVFATAGFAMGRRGLDFVLGVEGYEAFAIGQDLVATWTPGFDDYREGLPTR
jgi:thiamine biosynthesis lipoprotein